MTVNVERVIKQQQWIVVRRSIFEIPWLTVEEAVILRVDSGRFIERDVHICARISPGCYFRWIQKCFTAESLKDLRVTGLKVFHHLSGVQQILTRHEIG